MDSMLQIHTASVNWIYIKCEKGGDREAETGSIKHTLQTTKIRLSSFASLSVLHTACAMYKMRKKRSRKIEPAVCVQRLTEQDRQDALKTSKGKDNRTQ
jgi:hypothetical protein